MILFVIGGTTYEEARTVALFNQDPVAGSNGGITSAAAGTRILLGGTCVHNSSSYVIKASAMSALLTSTGCRYLEMLRSAAKSFPATVYEPPPESASSAPSLNLNLGGVNVSLGGAAGTGVYRTSSDGGVSVQADGLRDGVMNLLGKVKQGVDRIGTLPGP